jgi:chromosome segregation ATPase
MTTLTKFILGLVAVLLVCVIAGAALTSYQRGTDTEIQKLREQVGAAQAGEAAAKAQVQAAVAQSNEWKAQAAAAVARMATLEGRMKGVEAKLAAMGPVAPPTALESLPTAAPAIAKALTDAGVPAAPLTPAVGELGVGLSAPSAQKALGLVVDGLNYPKALARVEAMQEDLDLKDQDIAEAKTALADKEKEVQAKQVAIDKGAEALVECDKGSAAKDALVVKTNDLLKAERPKKWFWGLGGAALTALVILL